LLTEKRPSPSLPAPPRHPPFSHVPPPRRSAYKS
jgi:hypothetical protein